jgi:hypothetical protein
MVDLGMPGSPLRNPTGTKEALSKPDTYLIFLPPYHMARSARLVTIEEEIKGLWDWAANLYLGPFFRKIANDAPNGSAGGPNNGSAGGPKNLGTS